MTQLILETAHLRSSNSALTVRGWSFLVNQSTSLTL